MPTRGLHLPKVSAPDSDGAVARERVFALVDRARARPSVWVTAPGGAGKTTLIASYLRARRTAHIWFQIDAGDEDVAVFFQYLNRAAAQAGIDKRAQLPKWTADYLGSIDAFAANYFRELFELISAQRKPAVLVLDNYQELKQDSRLHSIIQLAIQQLPTGVNVVVLSREAPPPSWARERASDRMSFITWDDLQLSADESAAIVRQRVPGSKDAAALAEKLHARVQGWVAGLILLTEPASMTSEQLPRPAGLASQSIFDYFASEVLARNDEETQSFLLQTAFLPKFSAAMAQALTQSPQAQAVLDYLTRRNLFTLRHADGSYEYHALFRGFLSMRARERYSPELLATIKHQSAQLLADAGEVDAALVLLCELADWSAVSKLLHLKAEEWIAQGRTQTLITWLLVLPAEQRAHDPWLLYWLGVCKLSTAVVEARGHLERAFTLFEQQTDATPLYLTWSRIVDSFVLEWNDFTPLNPWLDRYATLATARKPPTSEAEAIGLFAYIAGLFHARADSPDLPVYAERAERLCRLEQNIDRLFARTVVLLPYYLWHGDWSKVEGLLQLLAPHVGAPNSRPLAKLYYYVWASFHASTSAALDTSINCIDDGLTFAHSVNLHQLDLRILAHGIWGQLCMGNLDAAGKLLARIKPPPPGQAGAHYDCFASMVLLHQGDRPAARKRSQSCLRQAKENSLFYSEAVYRVCAAYIASEDDVDTALAEVTDVRSVGERARSRFILYLCAFAEAHLQLQRDDTVSALQALRTAMALGKSIGIVTPPWILRSHAARLFALALEENIERDYVRSVIAKTELPPPLDDCPEHWPWAIRVYTLGRFAVIKDGAPLSFAGRTQQKPIELLRALTARGEREIGLHSLAQTLWPQAEGDAAKRAAEVTLHRLRKLIGERAIARNGNQLVLNTQLVWVDAWAFERELPAAAANGERLRRALRLYRGTFLPDEEGSWAIVLREKLRSDFLRGAANCGESLSGDAAADWYEAVIAIEPLAEALYLKLMLYHADQQHRAEAIAVYRRFHELSTAQLHLPPSDRMQREYERIRTLPT